MKKVLTGIFLVIDIVLLVVIISSLIKPKEKDSDLQGEKYEVAKEYTQKDSSDKSKKTKKRMEETQDSEEAAPTEEPAEYYDTEGIDGIVDIEEDGIEKEDIDEKNIEEMPAPSLSDFMWYYDGVYYNGVPDDAEWVFTKDKLRGAWKLFFWFGHDASGSYDAMEFANVMLEPDGNNVLVSVKMCRLYIPNSEVIDETDDPIHTYSGTWDGNGIYATGAGNINITTFYEMPDGHQYALGTFDAPDGTPTVIALARP